MVCLKKVTYKKIQCYRAHTGSPPVDLHWFFEISISAFISNWDNWKKNSLELNFFFSSNGYFKKPVEINRDSLVNKKILLLTLTTTAKPRLLCTAVSYMKRKSVSLYWNFISVITDFFFFQFLTYNCKKNFSDPWKKIPVSS